MFQSFARKATATAKPVKINGVDRVSVSRIANWDPAAPRKICANTENGSAPAANTRSAAMNIVAKIAAAGMDASRIGLGSVLGSSLMYGLRMIAVPPRHEPAKLLDPDLAAIHCRGKSAV